MLRTKHRARVAAIMSLLAGGTLYLPFVNQGCLDHARFFNPCAQAGDVFTPTVCTQAEFDDLFDGFAPNYARDPFCSLPQTCVGTTFDVDAGDGETGALDTQIITIPTGQ